MHLFTRLFALFCWLTFFRLPHNYLNAQNIFLQGKYVQLGIHPAGSFGSSVGAPPNYHSNMPGSQLGFICDVEKNGWFTGTPAFVGDYFIPGIPEEGWGMEWQDKQNKGAKAQFFNFGLMGSHDVVTLSHTKEVSRGREQAHWLGRARKFGSEATVYQTVTLDSAALYFTINVLIKNNGTDTLFHLKYFRNVDPDNEHAHTGSYTTHNYIENQPGWWGNTYLASVVALGDQTKAPCILGAVDARARVSIGGFSVRNVSDILGYADSSKTQSTPSFRDEAISIGFDLGPVAPGKCVSFAYYYALQNINPRDIDFPINTQFDISDDRFLTRQSFSGGSLCVRDTILQFAVTLNGSAAPLIDKVLWDANADGKFESEGDTVTLNFKGWKQHQFTQRLVFCDGSSKDSTYVFSIEPMPIVKFKAESLDPCFNQHEFKIENNSYWLKDSIQTFTWKFEGSPDITSNNPKSHRFETFSASKTITLVAETQIGCIDSQQIDVPLFAVPTLNVAFRDTSGCWRDNQFRVSIDSSNNNGNTLKPEIDWGDGVIATRWCDVHNYAEAGLYSAVVQITSVKNCRVADTLEFTIHPQPKADFTINDSLQCFMSHVFECEVRTDLHDSAEGIWQWSALNTTGSLRQFRVVSTVKSDFPIQLVRTSEMGCSDTLIQNVGFSGEPVASFEIQVLDSCWGTQKIQVVDQSVSEESYQIQWWINDQLMGSEWPEAFRFQDGDRIKQRIVNSENCVDSSRTLVKIYPHPTAQFQMDSFVCENMPIKALNTSGIDSSAKYIWTLGTLEYNTRDLILDLGMQAGSQVVVKLRAENAYGCSNEITQRVNVVPNSYVELLIEEENLCAKGNEIKVHARNTRQEVNTVNEHWQWSDGMLEKGPIAHRRALGSGRWQLWHFTENERGCIDTLTHTFTVRHSLKLQAKANSVCMPEWNSFEASSSAENDIIKKETWQVAEQVFYGSRVKRFLKDAGSYNVVYMAETEKGCRDTLKLADFAQLKPKPKAGFELDSFYSEGLNMSLILRNSASADVNHWRYMCNDWGVRIDANPHFSFTDTGMLHMTQIVGNSEACFDTASQILGPYLPIFYVHVPNAFTPNEDEWNQTFKPIITPYLMKYSLEIYNRWGELLFKTNDPNDAWDGTFNQRPVQEGVYVYLLYATDLKGYFHKDKGVVTLMRKTLFH